jgi:MFS transporter, FSR family, fosmidomycin resistance protein
MVFKPSLRSVARTVLVLYGVELLDELIYGLRGAVLPQIKSDLALTYTEIGLLTTIPSLVALVGEPIIGLLGDTRYRRALVVGGISATVLDLFLTSLAQNVALLLFASIIGFTASGAYVNLAQATLIDRNPARAEQTMARWTLLGSIGVAMAPVIVTAAFALGYGWRVLYLALALAAGFYVILLGRERFDTHAGAEEPSLAPRQLGRNLFAALHNAELLRWVALTELADLMLDRLLEVTGLYFHNVVGVGFAEASGGVAIFTAGWLVGNALLLPALEQVSGLRWLRASAAVVLLLYVAFLTVPFALVKFILLGAIGLGNAGWFAILRGKTYALLPGQSGLIVAITSLASVLNLLVPVIIGGMADSFGLPWAMWLLALGPLALLIGLPKH